MPSAPQLGRLVLVVAAFAAATAIAVAQDKDEAVPAPVALLATIAGPIGPAETRHIGNVVRAATARRAEVLILRIDTPGGLADSMRDIISEILASPVPVVGYVAPSGAHAASAGTYILYATHLAAMAPGTNLGAATPVSIGGLPGMPPPAGDEPAKRDDRPPGDETRPGDGIGDRLRVLSGDDAMTAKVTNDAVAFIRSLAEMRGRNADWAERAVREAASLSAAEALKQGVIEFIATDEEQLLAAIDGRRVTAGGKERVLVTRGIAIERIEMDGITRLLGVLSNPNVALLLMMIGVYGILFEFWSPGAVAPGVIGAICLTLGLYALNQLPLDYAGLALITIGIGFLVAEAFVPSFGILGFGGLAAFVLGAAMLVDTDVAAYRVSWWVIGALAALSAVMLVLVLGYTLRAYRRPPVSGSARMLGAGAMVLDWSGEGGFVWAEGERWRATGARDLAPGTSVRISGVSGLTLMIAPAADGRAAQRREGRT